MAIEIVSFPINSMVDLSIVMLKLPEGNPFFRVVNFDNFFHNFTSSFYGWGLNDVNKWIGGKSIDIGHERMLFLVIVPLYLWV